MKKDIHPKEHRFVVFQDVSCDYKFLKGIRKLCNKHKIILIYDEIYTGWSKNRCCCPDSNSLCCF